MSFGDALRRILTTALAVASGLLLFAAAASASLDGSIFNSSFHLKLIDKYDIYSQLEKVADQTLKNYLTAIEQDAAENAKQKEQLLSLADKAATPEMVRLNADALVEGLMKYFSGEARFLPDIYLKPAGETSSAAPDEAGQQLLSAVEQPLAGIDRISLSVVLMYMGRNDIVNSFSAIRLISFTLLYAPVFLVLLSFSLLVPPLMLAGKRKAKTRLTQAAASAGVSGIASACLLLGASALYLPGYTASSPLTAYVGKDILYEYALSCIQRPAAGLAVFGAVLLAAALLIRLLPGFVPKRLSESLASRLDMLKSRPGPVYVKFLAANAKPLFSAVLLLFLVCAFFINAEAMREDFHSKDLDAALERLRGANAYTAVVAARDEIIYSAEVRTVDKESGDPVQGLHMLLDGQLTDNGGKAYSERGISDEEGKAKFNLLKGSFKLGFDPYQFPEDYKIPDPYQFDINTAGTTIITVNLEKNEGKKPGIAELLVLGSGNKPVESLELTAEEYVQEGQESSAPGKVYSFTNQEGIAVFKLPEGRYTVSFTDTAFPAQYLPPVPLELDVTAGATVNYSLKLVEKKP